MIKIITFKLHFMEENVSNREKRTLSKGVWSLTPFLQFTRFENGACLCVGDFHGEMIVFHH